MACFFISWFPTSAWHKRAFTQKGKYKVASKPAIGFILPYFCSANDSCQSIKKRLQSIN